MSSLCNVWFDRSQRKRKIVEVDDEQHSGSSRIASLPEERHKKRQKRSQPSLNFDYFHNVLVADWTPLFWAAAKGNDAVLKLPLEKSVIVNFADQMDRNSWTPAQHVAWEGLEAGKAGIKSLREQIQTWLDVHSAVRKDVR